MATWQRVSADRRRSPSLHLERLRVFGIIEGANMVADVVERYVKDQVGFCPSENPTGSITEIQPAMPSTTVTP